MGHTITIQTGLAAHFKQPSGPSRPGIDWAVKISGDHTETVLVRTFFSSDPPQEIEKQALAQKALQFIQNKLDQGWIPTKGAFTVE